MSRRVVIVGAIAACLGFGAIAGGAHPDWSYWLRGWPGLGRFANHAAVAPTAALPLVHVRWSTPVDLDPQYSGTVLYIHYGSPVITPGNTVILPVKTGANDGFKVEARRGSDGALLWTMGTDYSLPSHNWVPPCGITLTRDMAVLVPAAGGTVLRRAPAEAISAPAIRQAFFGLAAYQANPGAYNVNVRINTPITASPDGSAYFGFVVTGSTPIGLQSGIARIDARGTGTWISAAAASGDPSIEQVVHNCAPALSEDGSVLYVGVREGWGGGYLLALDSSTLALLHKVRLKDPQTGSDAQLYDDGTATPTIGPDGDVFYGVLENPFFSNHLRGWMLHFNATLTQTKLPGAFGWDDSGSIVPSSAVPSYSGKSPYLLLTKYNNYVEGGGDGVNKVAVLDPGASMADPVTGITVMKEILTIAGPTPDPGNIGPNSPNAVREWCINTAAVDPATRCALVNNEDGKLYRWDFTTNTLSQTVVLTPGIGEAYTPTVVGPDGTVYAINNARLFAVGN
jgi:hypothetical protein